MKQVKVYTLREDDLIITNGMDSISFYSDKNLRPVLASSSTEFYDSSVSTTQSPIKRVIIDGKDYYYSFDPKLEKVMKAYYGVYDLELNTTLMYRRITELGIQIKQEKDKTLQYKDRLLGTQIELAKYETMSLWERIVFLFTGRV